MKKFFRYFFWTLQLFHISTVAEQAELCITDPACLGSCPSPGGCTECRATYGKDSTGKCKPCSTQPGGCTLCTTMSKCDTCPYGSVPLYPGPGCGACAASCSNCSASGPGRCDRCNPGNFLDPTTRTCKACTVQNCNLCPNSASTCAGCKSGYSLIGGACTQCDPHCSYCVNAGAGKCDPGRCSPGYGIDPSTGNTCIACSTRNCSKCEPPTGPCQTCLNSKFQLQADGTCKA